MSFTINTNVFEITKTNSTSLSNAEYQLFDKSVSNQDYEELLKPFEMFDETEKSKLAATCIFGSIVPTGNIKKIIKKKGEKEGETKHYKCILLTILKEEFEIPDDKFKEVSLMFKKYIEKSVWLHIDKLIPFLTLCLDSVNQLLLKSILYYSLKGKNDHIDENNENKLPQITEAIYSTDPAIQKRKGDVKLKVNKKPVSNTVVILFKILKSNWKEQLRKEISKFSKDEEAFKQFLGKDKGVPKSQIKLFGTKEEAQAEQDKLFIPFGQKDKADIFDYKIVEIKETSTKTNVVKAISELYDNSINSKNLNFAKEIELKKIKDSDINKKVNELNEKQKKEKESKKKATEEKEKQKKQESKKKQEEKEKQKNEKEGKKESKKNEKEGKKNEKEGKKESKKKQEVKEESESESEELPSDEELDFDEDFDENKIEEDDKDLSDFLQDDEEDN